MIDPNPETCRQVLETKRNSFVTVAYADTKEYRTLEDYIEDAKVSRKSIMLNLGKSI